ncbi:hypothetical protein [Desulfovibrio inopinatus]|uniref:hypothetical protein n=1 Tax=Desulfovibrio inopinatus TaxID=102109 RepID=UPI0004272220|nr:hypothetical protein [Desulfovibrio inopinatus]
MTPSIRDILSPASHMARSLCAQRHANISRKTPLFLCIAVLLGFLFLPCLGHAQILATTPVSFDDLTFGAISSVSFNMTYRDDEAAVAFTDLVLTQEDVGKIFTLTQPNAGSAFVAFSNRATNGIDEYILFRFVTLNETVEDEQLESVLFNADPDLRGHHLDEMQLVLHELTFTSFSIFIGGIPIFYTQVHMNADIVSLQYPTILPSIFRLILL